MYKLRIWLPTSVDDR